MASVLDPGELRQGRSGQKELFDLVNWLRRNTRPTVDADVWTSSDQTTAFPNSVNMGALGPGILEQTVTAGVATPSSFLGTEGSVLFLGPSGALAEDNANLFWHNANNTLGIGTNTPDPGDVGIVTRLQVYGSQSPILGAGGNVRALLQNAQSDGLAAMLLLNNRGVVNDTVYAGAGVALYYTGETWAGYEGANAVVLMAPNPGIVTDPTIAFGFAGNRKVIIPFGHFTSSESLFRICNPEKASSGGSSALMIDNNQPGVAAAIRVVGHSNASFPIDSLVINHDGGAGMYLQLAGVTYIQINPAGTVELSSLAGAGTAFVTADATGLLARGASASGFAPVDATYITQIPNATLTNEQALSLLGTGVMSSTTATGVVATTTFTAGSVAFGKNSILGQDNAGLFYDDSDRVLVIGTNLFTAGQRLKIIGTRSLASAAGLTWDTVYIDPGTLTLTGGTHVTTARGLDGVYVAAPTITDGSAVTVDQAATVVIGGAPAAAGSVTITNRYALWSIAGAIRHGDLAGAGTAAVTVDADGVLARGGAASITWPTAEYILYSTGTTTDPSGYVGFAFDVTGLAVSYNTSTPLHIYNLGTRNADADYERLLITNTANIYLIKSEKNGTGTVRNIKIDADTALLRLNALDVQVEPGATQTWNKATGTNYERVRAQWGTSGFTGADSFRLVSEAAGSGTVRSISIEAGAGTASLAGTFAQLIADSGAVSLTTIGTAGSEQNAISATISRASAAGMVLDAHKFNTTLTISGVTNITTAAGVNSTVFGIPTYDGIGSAKNITAAATVTILGAPNPTNSATITTAYALWVQTGLVEFSGNSILCGNGQTLGFFGSLGTTRQTSAADLTNNVTSGGTNNQIDDFTDLIIYANDAATIRNDIYQLSRKLKQVNDGLRAYGILS